MKKALIFIISILSTLLICGFSPAITALSVASVTAYLWLEITGNFRGKSLYSINNPKLHNPELTALAIGECLSETRKSEKPLQLMISNPGKNRLSIRRTADGGMKISDSHRSLKIEHGELWIPDHPMPLILKAEQNLQLNFAPAIDGRIHVSTGTGTCPSKLPLILIPIAAVLVFCDFHSSAAVLTAPVIYTLIFRRCAHMTT